MPANLKVILAVATKGLDGFGKAKQGAEGLDKKVSGLSARMRAMSTVAGAAAVAALGAFAKQSISAAMSVEIFRTQLESVSGSAAAADQALNAIREFARTSPLQTEDVVRGYVRLRAVGIDPTIEQMKTIGGVATLFNRELSDVVNGFIGMEKEVLRRLGIEIDRTGKKAIISSGNIQKEVNKDMASMRQAVVETWGERFPEAMENASKTTSSKLEIMKSNVWELAAEVGGNLTPAINVAADAVGGLAEQWKILLENKMGKAIKNANKTIAKMKKFKGELKEIQDRLKNGFYPESVSDDIKKMDAIFGTHTYTLAEAKARVKELREQISGLNQDQQTKTSKGLGSGSLGPSSELEDKAAADKAAAAAKEKQKQIVDTQYALNEAMIEAKYEGIAEEIALLELKYEKEKELLGTNHQAIANLTDTFMIQRNEMVKKHTLDMENIRLESQERLREANMRDYEQEQELTKQRIQLAKSATSQMVGSLAALVTAIDDSSRTAKAAAIVQAIAEAGAAAVTAYKAGMQSGVTVYDKLGLAFGAMSTAILSTSIIIANMKKAALGRTFMTNGPMIIGDTLVGDNPGGRERITVEPVSSSNANGPMNSSGGTVNNIYINDPITGEKMMEKMRRDGTMRTYALELREEMGL